MGPSWRPTAILHHPSCLLCGSCCKQMLPPRSVSSFEKAALQLHIWLCVQTLDIKNSSHTSHYPRNKKLKKKKTHTFQSSVFCVNKKIKLHTCALSCTTKSFKSWKKTSVLLVTQDTMTWHVWCIFKGVFNIIHFTQQFQVLKLWAWFWSNTTALQWTKAKLSKMLTKTLLKYYVNYKIKQSIFT